MSVSTYLFQRSWKPTTNIVHFQLGKGGVWRDRSIKTQQSPMCSPIGPRYLQPTNQWLQFKVSKVVKADSREFVVVIPPPLRIKFIFLKNHPSINISFFRILIFKSIRLFSIFELKVQCFFFSLTFNVFSFDVQNKMYFPSFRSRIFEFRFILF